MVRLGHFSLTLDDQFGPLLSLPADAARTLPCSAVFHIETGFGQQHDTRRAAIVTIGNSEKDHEWSTRSKRDIKCSPSYVHIPLQGLQTNHHQFPHRLFGTYSIALRPFPHVNYVILDRSISHLSLCRSQALPSSPTSPATSISGTMLSFGNADHAPTCAHVT